MCQQFGLQRRQQRFESKHDLVFGCDGDGYYTGASVTQCTSPGAGYRYTGLLGGGDCNDGNSALNPNTIWYLDADGDNIPPARRYRRSAPRPGAGYAL
jgi:hypothetical protein